MDRGSRAARVARRHLQSPPPHPQQTLTAFFAASCWLQPGIKILHLRVAFFPPVFYRPTAADESRAACGGGAFNGAIEPFGCPAGRFAAPGPIFGRPLPPPKPGFVFRISGHPVAPTARSYRRALTVRLRRGKVKVCIKCNKCNFKLSSCQTLCIVCCETVSLFIGLRCCN